MLAKGRNAGVIPFLKLDLAAHQRMYWMTKHLHLWQLEPGNVLLKFRWTRKHNLIALSVERINKTLKKKGGHVK